MVRPKDKIFLVATLGLKSGVKSSALKLYRALEIEGYKVKMIYLNNKNLIELLFSDLKSISSLKTADKIIYLGSIPRLSNIFMKDKLWALFLHGFLMQESLEAMRESITWEDKLLHLLLISYWRFSLKMNRPSFYVCRSLTSCEMNNVLNKDHVILKQFIFPEEVISMEHLKKMPRDRRSNRVRIVAFTSHSKSPRLLPRSYILQLVRKASKQVRKGIELQIIDPLGRNGYEETFENLKVRYLAPMPRREFLSLLAQSDLYIERCIDEELGNSSIEAGLLGVPILKYTHPKYIERQDYTDTDLIVSSSLESLIRNLIEYVNNVDFYKEIYSQQVSSFILKRRNWDVVKQPLIRRLSLE